jgi:hypothetical protein
LKTKKQVCGGAGGSARVAKGRKHKDKGGGSESEKEIRDDDEDEDLVDIHQDDPV